MTECKNRVGCVIADRYEIISEKGRGGMSVVYIAKDRKLGTLWAVKEFLKRDDAEEELELRKSIESEAELLKNLDHPSLVRIVDVVEADDSLFIIMDYVNGDDLLSILEDQRHREPFPVETVVDWGIELCDALDYLHTPDPSTGKGVILYRDLKPANLVLRNDGTLRMIDFGIAKQLKEGSKDYVNTTFGGSKAYGAPEQFLEDARSDIRIDIYALGTTLHELVTGEPANKHVFHPQPIREYNSQLPEGLERIIKKCTEFNPEKRYSNCQEVRADLERYEKLTKEYENSLKRKIRVFAILCALAVLFVVVAVAGFMLSESEKQSTYAAYMLQADNIVIAQDAANAASDRENKIELYENAIEVDPSASDPYRNILTAMIGDGEFDSSDADRYYKLISGYAEKSCSTEDYAELCYDFANVYFSYTSNYAQASMWFSNAVSAGGLNSEKTTNANSYIAICDFRSNLSSKEKLNSLDSSEPYVTYWNGLCDAFDNALGSSTPHTLLKLSELIVDACSSEAYTVPLKNGGIEQDDLLERLDKVWSEVKEREGSVITVTDRELFDYVSLHYAGYLESTGEIVEPASSVIARTYQNTTATAKITEEAPVVTDDGGELR